MVTADVLIELGTEELPPKTLLSLSEAFTNSITALVEKEGFQFESVQSFATPRRLAVLYKGILKQQADKVIEKRGPAVSIAFDKTGEPSKAGLGWARGLGIDISQAERIDTPKGEWLVYHENQQGQTLAHFLPSFIQQAVKELPVPKVMHWGDGEYAFIRPLKRLTVMIDADVVPMELFGIAASNRILGHRFHSQGDLALSNASNYESLLKEHFVIADFDLRRQLILDGITEQAKNLQGSAILDDHLLDEVTSLVEWPVVLTASFDEAYLSTPQEALIFTMKDDQRYFPLVDADNQLLPRFIFVSNIDSKEKEKVISGNEKVISPRLADAQFFYNQDKQTKLEDRLEVLGNVTFQQQLGSIKDKVKRMAHIAEYLAKNAHVQSGKQADVATVKRAALLTKADLTSLMVQEFPEIQGIMGGYYAQNDGEAPEVALAIKEHYQPAFAKDSIPSSLEGCIVSLADKLDTLVGIFATGQLPRSDRDPFALRRAAIGIVRIFIEKKVSIQLPDLVHFVLSVMPKELQAQLNLSSHDNDETVKLILDFINNRLRAFYTDNGVPADVFLSVYAITPTDIYNFNERIKAVQHFNQLPEAQSLAAANKRVHNILSKDEGFVQSQVDTTLFDNEYEKALYQQLLSVQAELKRLDEFNYIERLSKLVILKDPIDQFFEHVMVNVDDNKVRSNRLNIFAAIYSEFKKIADFSQLNS